MGKRYRHPELGAFHKLDLSGGSIAGTHVPDKMLDELINFLNGPEKSTRSNKTLEILEEMLQLDRITPPVWNEQIDGSMVVMKKGTAWPNPTLKRHAPAKYALQVEINQRQDSINRQLARYRFLPHASPHWVGGRWLVTWKIVSPRDSRKRNGVHQEVLSEGVALHLILDFARAGYLNRFRRCSRCGKWLYAKFRHQAFCSTECQQKHYSKSEDWRRKRREYMRQYRQRTMSP